jgi:hypothetical protein
VIDDFLDLAVFEIAEQDAESGEEYEKGEEGTAERPESQATANTCGDGDDAPAGVAANFEFPLFYRVSWSWL